MDNKSAKEIIKTLHSNYLIETGGVPFENNYTKWLEEKLSAQSAPLATEGLPVKSNIDLKAIEKEVDEALTIENVTEYLKTHPLPSQLEGNTLKQVQKLRDELFESLPTGKVSAFDLIGIIANHIEKLDNLSTLTAPIPAEREGKDAVRFGKFLREHGFQTMNGIMQNMTTTELYQRYKQYLSTLK